MDNDRMAGKAKDLGGRIKRQAGEWTGNEKLQGEGAADQAEGKVQNAWGKVKDGARDLKDDMTRDHDKDKKDRDAA